MIAARRQVMQSLDSRGCFVRFLRDDARFAGSGALRLALRPFGAAYGAAVRLRRAAYRRGLLRVADLGAPVISIGNLSAGGTGKTPMVEWVVGRLRKMGRRPAILSRGYRAHQRVPGRVRNDEALLLERHLPGVPQYAAPDRVASGRRAVEEGADCLVLDDGFQHLRARRNLDIVLVDALKPLRGRRIIPAGDLREPLSALRCADAVVLTRADLLDAAALAARREEVAAFAPGVPLVEAAHRAASLDDVCGRNPEPVESLSGKRAMLFCGIGNPQGFLATVQALKAEISASHFLPDHFHYSQFDVERLAALLEQSGAEVVLTTEKDAVKLEPFLETDILTQAQQRFLRRLRVLRVETAILSGEDILDNLLKRAVA